MTLADVNALISQVGFPIVCVLGLGWFIYHSYTDIMTRSAAREEKLYEIINAQSAQLQEFAKTNPEFLTVLGEMQDDLEAIKDRLPGD